MNSSTKYGLIFVLFFAAIAAIMTVGLTVYAIVPLIMFSLVGLVLFFVFEMFWIDKIYAFLALFRSKRYFMNKMLVFVAAIMKVDKRVSNREQEAVVRFFKQKFSVEDAEYLAKRLDVLIKSDLKIKQDLLAVKRTFPAHEKNNLIYLLVWIATIDRILTKEEDLLLKHITVKLGLRVSTYYSNLRYFEFQKAEDYYREQQQKNAGKSAQKSRNQLLEEAYAILQIKRSASVKEIKKAYRKLAKTHHPDRAVYNKQTATEKFQFITKAYDLIKEKRGF
jgi:DnaJ like chaperone protein